MRGGDSQPLQSGEVSDIVEGSDVLYVFLMQEPDCTALAQYYFKQLVSDAQTSQGQDEPRL